jgi:hypothetical protein
MSLSTKVRLLCQNCGYKDQDYPDLSTPPYGDKSTESKESYGEDEKILSLAAPKNSSITSFTPMKSPVVSKHQELIHKRPISGNIKRVTPSRYTAVYDQELACIRDERTINSGNNTEVHTSPYTYMYIY